MCEVDTRPEEMHDLLVALGEIDASFKQIERNREDARLELIEAQRAVAELAKEMGKTSFHTILGGALFFVNIKEYEGEPRAFMKRGETL